MQEVFFHFLKEMKVQRYKSDSCCLVSQNPSDSSLRQTRGKWQEIPELLECVTKLKKNVKIASKDDATSWAEV